MPVNHKDLKFSLPLFFVKNSSCTTSAIQPASTNHTNKRKQLTISNFAVKVPKPSDESNHSSQLVITIDDNMLHKSEALPNQPFSSACNHENNLLPDLQSKVKDDIGHFCLCVKSFSDE